MKIRQTRHAIKRLAGTVAVGTAIVMVTPMAAHATSSCSLHDVLDRLRASGSFSSSTDKFSVKDQREDGKSVQLTYTTVQGSSWILNSAGKGKTKSRDLSLPAGSRVTYYLSFGDKNGSSITNPIGSSGVVVDKA